jgi:hypothetical protein
LVAFELKVTKRPLGVTIGTAPFPPAPGAPAEVLLISVVLGSGVPANATAPNAAAAPSTASGYLSFTGAPPSCGPERAELS